MNKKEKHGLEDFEYWVSFKNGLKCESSANGLLCLKL
jgi:hypothetical protein